MIEIILIVSALCGIGIPFIIWGITPWLILWIPLFGCCVVWIPRCECQTPFRTRCI